MFLRFRLYTMYIGEFMNIMKTFSFTFLLFFIFDCVKICYIATNKSSKNDENAKRAVGWCETVVGYF